MPWWVGVVLAIASYLLLHHWAAQPVTATAQSGQVGTMVTQTLWPTLAGVGQYVLPLICLAGAGVSAWRRNERRQRVADVLQSHAAVLDGMSWQQFEKLVGEGFRLEGYRVAETGGGGADGGVDLVLTRGAENFLVQCKQWRASRVGVDVVRGLYGVMAARGATGGFVVTSGRFSDDAAAFAEGRNIGLMDGTELHALIRRTQAATPARHARADSGRRTRISANSACATHRGRHAVLPGVFQAHGEADRETWCQGRQRVLGLLRVSVLSRHPASGLNVGAALMSRHDTA
ncbi:MAG: hypothetical protein Fur0039_18070 [Rhodocyclaceae bacterium]